VTLHGNVTAALAPLAFQQPITPKRDVKDAVDDRRPDELLAQKSAEHAAGNDLQNIRLANHLDAARRELSYALALVIVWALRVPVTGSPEAERAASTPSAPWTHVPGLRHHPCADRARGLGGLHHAICAAGKAVDAHHSDST
jgi:hypothetical protein